MARRITLLLGSILLLGGLILAARWWTARAPSVSGFLEAYEIRLGSRVGGRAAKVYVDEGDVVAAGEVLVQLDPFDLLARQAEAKALLAAREADYERLRQGFRPEEITQARQHYENLAARHEQLVDGSRKQEIEVARQRLAAAEAEATLAQQQHDRTQQLFERKAIARDEMDQSIAELSVAQRTVAVRQEELNLLLEGTRPEEIAAAKAQMEGAMAAWELHKRGYRQEDIAQAKALSSHARPSSRP
ncbi:MAG: biotin/lipoyl-binding protein [Patescibacteria group bacterium]|nr:biotin/lipoyl-binding protein [Patescibacteria group bacterium]